MTTLIYPRIYRKYIMQDDIFFLFQKYLLQNVLFNSFLYLYIIFFKLLGFPICHFQFLVKGINLRKDFKKTEFAVKIYWLNVKI